MGLYDIYHQQEAESSLVTDQCDGITSLLPFLFFCTTGVLTDSWAIENENWQSTKSIPGCREPLYTFLGRF